MPRARGTSPAGPTFGRIVLWWRIFRSTPAFQGIARRIGGRPLVIAIPYLWLLLFFVIPFVIVLKISFAESRIAMPPYSPFWEWTSNSVVQIKLTLANYAFLFQDALYSNAYLSSMRIAGISTILCLLIGYPMSYGMARSKPSTRNILPLYSTLEKLDNTLLEAAADLGCRPMKAFLKITLPLSMPGIIAGCMLVFIPAVGEYVIPALLGGPDTLMIGRVLWDEFFGNRDWPVASAVAIAMLLLLVVPIMIFQYAQGRDMRAHK